MRLLLVEDDWPLGQAVRAGLRQNGFTVDWVRDGEAADHALSADPFDLLVLDLQLPGRDGLQVLLRRDSGRATPLIVHGPLQLDPAARKVRVGGEPVALSPREFALLQLLLENAGRVLSRERLEEALYGWDSAVDSNTVEVYVHHLRKKFGSDLISTVRGVGYMVERCA
ncbi:MAG: response regulator transcription factor [Gammaproteobacteria bacterium]|nr:response regulator transcription factor [Gammaproteobacteria bacterium]NIR97699.1 response regulator transcription factor [Gammaproteobacteria bacterium]NIT62892.1 response regulator transcription factor [Gammaproteobacteria bacterium]NIV19857.1 response regulator [Gammaproteobacteria bacterium]NIX11370.1 response regulator [Gammaproteobacteria bacterium]